MNEDPLLVELDHPFALHFVEHPQIVEHQTDRLGGCRKDVQVDVGAAANVAGQGRTDQPWVETPQRAHQRQCPQPHLAEPILAISPLEQRGHAEDLVPDLGVRGEVLGLGIHAHSPGGLSLGDVILGDLAFVHQPRCLERDPPPDTTICHFAAPR